MKKILVEITHVHREAVIVSNNAKKIIKFWKRLID